MTISCTDCRKCGDCYPKDAVCSRCGNTINLLDEACKHCGSEITEQMRLDARNAFKKEKQKEFDLLFPRRVPGLPGQRNAEEDLS